MMSKELYLKKGCKDTSIFLYQTNIFQIFSNIIENIFSCDPSRFLNNTKSVF